MVNLTYLGGYREKFRRINLSVFKLDTFLVSFPIWNFQAVDVIVIHKISDSFKKKNFISWFEKIDLSKISTKKWLSLDQFKQPSKINLMK